MTSSSRKQYRLDVEAFSLFSDEGTSVHFELDGDLYIGVDRALGNNPDPTKRKRIASQAALVLIELGIDGDHTHKVRVQRTGNVLMPGQDPALYADAFNYPGAGEAFILGDAIEALQAVLDQLLVMRSVEEAGLADTAYSVGPDAAACTRCGLNAGAMIHHATANGHNFEGARVNLNAHAPQYREANERFDRDRDQ